MEPLLRVRALHRRFGAKPVLRGLEFRLEPGDVLGLLGPNGAGKTTCLRILSGNLAPSSGQVSIRGRDIAAAAARSQLGYLPERPPLYPEMRVDEYLHFCARLHRVPPRAIGQAVDRIKRRCGLAQAGRRLLGKLSKGYQQRAGLAQALIHEPELVILDEPTDGLDPLQIREVRELIRDLAPSAGVIVSSHALAEVQAVCNRVIILRDGEVLHQGALPDADADNRFCVRLRHPPATAELTALSPIAVASPVFASGTSSETASAPSRFRIELADGASPDQLAAALVGSGWGLLELVPERTDLERVFFQSIDAEARP